MNNFTNFDDIPQEQLPPKLFGVMVSDTLRDVMAYITSCYK
jgi:hypothetical protein